MNLNSFPFISLCFVLFNLQLFGQTYSVIHPAVFREPEPDWVVNTGETTIEISARKVSEGYYIKLYDYQNHVEKQTSYIHIIRQIVAESGVQQGAEITVNFVPAYQKLVFHKLIVRRGNQETDRLDIRQIRVVSLEQEASSYIYTGAYCAYITPEDVRVGDQVEFSYSIIGRNPVFGDRFHTEIYLQSSVPAARIYASVLAAPERLVKIKNFNDAPVPQVVKIGHLEQKVWDVASVEGIPYEAYSPAWYNHYQHVQLSEFENWNEVAVWAEHTNPVPVDPGAELTALADRIMTEADGDLSVYADMLISLIQEEIRYTSISIGELSHKATRPDKVYRQRYGDCKDKSLLLVCLLRYAGIEAHMALVNSSIKGYIADKLPSPGVFDHAVVRFVLNDKVCWIDPTRTYQGGHRETRYFPDFGKALLVSDTVRSLIPIEVSGYGRVSCREKFTISIEDSTRAALYVRTSYSGVKADITRARFAYGSLSEIERSYLDYYARLYPLVEMVDSITYEDDREKNVFVVEEWYSIPGFLNKNPQTGAYDASVFAGLINDQLPDILSNKNVPVAVDFPSEVEHFIHIDNPYGWNVNDGGKRIDGDGYVYEEENFTEGNVLLLRYLIHYTRPDIEGGGRAKFAADCKDIKNNRLTYTISIPGLGISEAVTGINTKVLSYIVILIATLILIAYKLYHRSWNTPFPSEEERENIGIGGWLILPFIGLLILPVRTLIEMYSVDFLNAQLWEVMRETLNYYPYVFMLLFELTGNLIILVFSVLCIFMALGKKSAFPVFMVVLYAFIFVFNLLDNFLIDMFDLTAVGAESDYFPVFRFAVYGLIWGVYMMMSERVKRTFVNA